MNKRSSALVILAIWVLLSQGSQELAFAPTLQVEGRNPWNHLDFPDRSEAFHFAIVADRGGGHRPGVFKRAIDRLEVLDPSFVMSVGDLLDTQDIGANPDLFDEETIESLWAEFNTFVEDLPMPFFYVAGNNDIRSTEMKNIWHQQLGRTYYRFRYQDVLFIVLNSEDIPGSPGGGMSDAQLEWLRTTLLENGDARWTMIFLHRPMWLYPEHPGWTRVEELLGSRSRTVFAGHHHRYSRSVIDGNVYYGLATTGAGDGASVISEGQFDHVVWVTMTDEGPNVLNLMLDGFWGDDPAAEIRN